MAKQIDMNERFEQLLKMCERLQEDNDALRMQVNGQPKSQASVIIRNNVVENLPLKRRPEDMREIVFPMLKNKTVKRAIFDDMVESPLVQQLFNDGVLTVVNTSAIENDAMYYENNQQLTYNSLKAVVENNTSEDLITYFDKITNNKKNELVFGFLKYLLVYYCEDVDGKLNKQEKIVATVEKMDAIRKYIQTDWNLLKCSLGQMLAWRDKYL